MKYTYYLLFIPLLSYNIPSIKADRISNRKKLLHPSNAITNQPSGRLGDVLASYCKAKWMAYLHDTPYYYRPFEYSDQLHLHDIEQFFNEKLLKKFTKTFVRLWQETDLKTVINGEPILYSAFLNSNITINWEDTTFRNMMRSLIAPRYPLNLELNLPENRLHIAIHIRHGGGFDEFYVRKDFPSRFPDLDYYIDQLNIVIAMFAQPLHAHIFTDHTNPLQFLETFKEKFKNKDITFSCRKKENKHNTNVLEDFFAMMKFDILIKSGSAFSYFVWALGDHIMMIQPKKMGTFNEQTGYWSVEEVEIIHRNKI